ncbi:hypothetical protein ABBQ38_005422 [Trebouxia sp. C0009 RCD-2024]
MRGLASLFCFIFRNWRFELTATWERSRRRWFASPIQLVLLQTQTAPHMGCCTSKSTVEEDSPLTGTGICQKQLYPPHISPTGLQVRASTATWVATLPYVEFSTVVLRDNSIFLAFFESESDNKAAAAYARASAHKAFEAAQATGQGDMQSVLQATFTSLDEGFLADTRLSSMDRASSAAGGVIVYLDFKAEKLWAGQIGLSKQLVIGRLFHGLAAQRTEALVLDNANVFNKQQGQRDEVQALIASTTACIVEQRLNAGDEHLVLASQGLWDVISPDDAALHLHFHLKANANRDLPTVAIQCDAVSSPLQAGTPQPAATATNEGGDTNKANAAEALVLYAMHKVAAKATRRYKPREDICETDLRNIPFKQRSDSAAAPPVTTWNKSPLASAVRSDVHGDMSAIVLSLRWPATSLNQALEMPIHTPPPKGKYRSPEQQAASERAQHRWGQIKMLHVEFYRARRMMLLSKWWIASSQIIAKGKIKARQLEERLWVERRMAVKVSPAMRIMDQYGRVVHPEDIDLELPDV